MNEFSNELSAAKQEMLILMVEECSEAIKACTKILRHGLHSFQNSGDLLEECADVLACLRILEFNGFINLPQMESIIKVKFARLKDPSLRRVHFIEPEMIPDGL